MQVTIKNIRKGWSLTYVCPYELFQDVNPEDMPCIDIGDNEPVPCKECRAAYMDRLTFEDD